jgi:hypothetical protein
MIKMLYSLINEMSLLSDKDLIDSDVVGVFDMLNQIRDLYRRADQDLEKFSNEEDLARNLSITDKILELALTNMTRQEIADEVGVGIATVYRVLKENLSE